MIPSNVTFICHAFLKFYKYWLWLKMPVRIEGWSNQSNNKRFFRDTLSCSLDIFFSIVLTVTHICILLDVSVKKFSENCCNQLCSCILLIMHDRYSCLVELYEVASLQLIWFCFHRYLWIFEAWESLCKFFILFYFTHKKTVFAGGP